jgi:hypothetical protein
MYKLPKLQRGELIVRTNADFWVWTGLCLFWGAVIGTILT